jgi:hypothetical protein
MDVADCSKKISHKDISDNTVLLENSVEDKTEINIQDSLLSCKENVLCCSLPGYKVGKKNVDA